VHGLLPFFLVSGFPVTPSFVQAAITSFSITVSHKLKYLNNQSVLISGFRHDVDEICSLLG
jgi:hypothetical protein